MFSSSSLARASELQPGALWQRTARRTDRCARVCVCFPAGSRPGPGACVPAASRANQQRRAGLVLRRRRAGTSCEPAGPRPSADRRPVWRFCRRPGSGPGRSPCSGAARRRFLWDGVACARPCTRASSSGGGRAGPVWRRAGCPGSGSGPGADVVQRQHGRPVRVCGAAGAGAGAGSAAGLRLAHGSLRLRGCAGHARTPGCRGAHPVPRPTAARTTFCSHCARD